MAISLIVSRRDRRRFSVAMEKQLPYAVAVALTRTAAQAKDEVKSDLPKHFTIRNKFTANSIRSQRAKKADWPHAYAVVGSVQPYLAIHEEGGVKRPGAKAASIPKGIRKSEKSIVRPNNWPGKLLPPGAKLRGGGRPKGSKNGSRRKPKPFLLQEAQGVGVYIRRGRKRTPLRRLYRLTKQPARIKPRAWLTQPVERVVRARLASNFEKALEEALRPG